MGYTKQQWLNGSAGNTPISASRLQHMEEGIDASVQADEMDPAMYPVLNDPNSQSGALVRGLATATPAPVVPWGNVDPENKVQDSRLLNLGTWVQETGTAGVASVASDADGLAGHVLRLTGSSTAAQASEDYFPVHPGDIFDVAVKHRRQGTVPTAGTVYMSIFFFDKDKVQDAGSSSGNVAQWAATTVTTAWGDRSGSITAPPGAAYAKVRFRISSTVDVGTLMDFQRIRVTRRRTASVEHRPVNVREAYGTDDTAVRAAWAAAMAQSRAIYFPAGAYAVTGDLGITLDAATIRGDGDLTAITFTNGGLVLDGTGAGAHLFRPTLRDFKLHRAGTVGAALHAKGAGAGTGVARLFASNLHLSAAGGDALLYEGSYTGAFDGCYFRSSATGIRAKLDTATNTVAMNLLTFTGGEAQGNSGQGVNLLAPRGVQFVGFGIEGNNGTGAAITGDAHGVGFRGCYFEYNQGAADIDFNPDTADRGALVIDGCVFYDNGANKNQSVYLRRGRALAVNYNRFGPIPASPACAIRVDADCGGEARYNYGHGTGGPTVVIAAGNSGKFTTVATA